MVGDEVVAEATGPSASLAAQGVSAAQGALDDLMAQLPVDKTRPVDVICVGAAGITRQHGAEVFRERLSAYAVEGRVLVVGDGYLVLPAAGRFDGVGVICGTGTVAFATWEGRASRAGGWGYLLGDAGSGYWVACRAVREVLERSDRGRPLGEVADELFRSVGAAGLYDFTRMVYQDPRPGRWAALAPVVLASRDPVVDVIIAGAGRALDELVGAALEGLGGPPDLPIVLAGGLTHQPRFLDGVMSHLRRQRPASEVQVLRQPPVAGAVRLAQRALRGESSWVGAL